MTEALVTHRHTAINPATATPRSDDVDGANWLEPHRFNAPVIGSVLVGDPSSSTGASWLAPSTPGLVIVSQGEGQLPSYAPMPESGPHNMLSIVHTDTHQTVIGRGSLMTVVDVGELKWGQFPLGPSGTVLTSNGADPQWVDILTDLRLDSLALENLVDGQVVVGGVDGAIVSYNALLWDSVAKVLKLGEGTGPVVLADFVTIGVKSPSGQSQFQVVTDVGIDVVLGKPTYDGAPRDGMLVGNGTAAQGVMLETGAMPRINAGASANGFGILHGGKTAKWLDGVFSVEGKLASYIGGSTTLFSPSGVLSSQVGAVGNPATTVETDAFTYTLPASAMSVNGQRLVVTAWGTKPLSPNTIVRLRFGGDELVSMTTGGSSDWMLSAEVLRTGAANQDVIGRAGRDIYIAPVFSQWEVDLSAAVVVKATVQSVAGAAVNQVVCRGFTVTWMPV